MNDATFSAWLKRMDLDDSAAAEALGCHRHSIRRWRTGETTIPRYIALACAAIGHGLKPVP